MGDPRPPKPATRLRRLGTARVLGREVAVAEGVLARLLGLALITRRRAGAGLLIPRCSSVHTFGMRFRIDVVFLGREGEVVRIRRGVGPGRIVCCRRADAALELPAEGGEDGPWAT